MTDQTRKLRDLNVTFCGLDLLAFATEQERDNATEQLGFVFDACHEIVDQRNAEARDPLDASHEACSEPISRLEMGALLHEVIRSAREQDWEYLSELADRYCDGMRIWDQDEGDQ